MQTERTSPTHRHGWWWLVLPALLVIYVLGIAPLNAWAIKEQISNGLTLPQPVWVAQLNAPLDWTLAHSRLAHDGWGLYQSWWIGVICVSDSPL
jgi:hypothetical protein